MKNFLLRSFAIFWWIGTLVYTVMLISFIKETGSLEAPHLIIALLIPGTFYLGRYLWRKSKSTLNKNDVKTTSILNEDRSLVKVEMKTQRENPEQVLNDMRKFYSNESLLGDLRILEDSISLMKSTKDIDTFLSRGELAHRTALNIEQATNAGIKVNSTSCSSKEVMDLKSDLLPNVLNNSFIKMCADASKLKTTKGKLGRYQKFLSYLEENEYELDLCDNYEEIINTTKNEISNFKHELAVNTKG